MKARIFIVLMAFLLVFTMGCSKESDGGTAAGNGDNSSETAEAFNINSYAFDWMYHWVKVKTETEAGEVIVSLEREKTPYWRINDVLTSNGETLTFENVEYICVKDSEGKEYYVRESEFIPNGVYGVITKDETFLYKKPDILSTSSITLNHMMIAVISPETENGFYRIAGYDPEPNVFRTGYIKDDNASIKEADVISAQLFIKAESTKDDKEKKELLKSAVTEYSSSVFYQEIRDALDVLESSEESPADGVEPAADQVEDYSSDNLYGKIIDDNVNVREFPGLSSAILPVTLNEGDRVKINKVTKAKYTIQGQTSEWYKLDEPEGWVFGAFIEIVN